MARCNSTDISFSLALFCHILGIYSGTETLDTLESITILFLTELKKNDSCHLLKALLLSKNQTYGTH